MMVAIMHKWSFKGTVEPDKKPKSVFTGEVESPERAMMKFKFRGTNVSAKVIWANSTEYKSVGNRIWEACDSKVRNL